MSAAHGKTANSDVDWAAMRFGFEAPGFCKDGMKLYTAYRAPYPRRVLMFMHEKQIADVQVVDVDLMKNEHRTERFKALNPFARIPVFELDDGRALSESRAICSWLEAKFPVPNLMGKDPEEHAWIEMHDRRMDFYWMSPVIAWIRNSMPNMDSLVGRQYPDYAQGQKEIVFRTAAWLDEQFTRQPWVAGERFTVADITAFCAIEVARIVHFRPRDAGFHALQEWRDRMAARDSARIE